MRITGETTRQRENEARHCPGLFYLIPALSTQDAKNELVFKTNRKECFRIRKSPSLVSGRALDAAMSVNIVFAGVKHSY